MNTNDIVFKVAARVKVLANLRMNELRFTNGYGCDTDYEALQKDKYKDRGTIIEEILLEEFCEDSPRDIEER